MAKKRFKLTDIFSRLGSKTNKEGTSFKAPSSSGNIKKEMDWKYGHGEFADIKKRRKPGESKFDYNVRMRKEGVKSSYQYQKDPDPKTEIKGLQGQEPLWAQSNPLGISSNPNDLTDKSKVQNYGIVPGMSFGEAFAQAGKGNARAGIDTFFWIDPDLEKNPEQKETKFLYDFEKKEEKNISDDVTVVGHGRQHATDMYGNPIKK